MENITHCDIRMYRMGTGDCFILKFFSDTEETFKMMIDCGVWTGAKSYVTEFIEDLLDYIDYEVDVLVVTHEHLDHVSVFDTCKDLFLEERDGRKFHTEEIWMGWTENDKTQKVSKWKKGFGEKKKALAFASKMLNEIVSNDEYKRQLGFEGDGEMMLKGQIGFSSALTDFAQLHGVNKSDREYKGDLEGMRIAKNEISKGKLRYFKPGDIEEPLKAAGIKFYILGPPEIINDVEIEGDSGTAEEGETYSHNDEFRNNHSFTNALLSRLGDRNLGDELPFSLEYLLEHPLDDDDRKPPLLYLKKSNHWRTIEYDWLNSAGSLALRMNSRTNNLSLAFAIEFEKTGKVMLFPGDAEYGSWASWHKIKWDIEANNKEKHLTEDLLNRTVFYKVAHHLSHNGTAKRLGLEMMTSKELAAMATLDYDSIAKAWKGTMPNEGIINELLKKTKGKLMISNEEHLTYASNKKIKITDKVEEFKEKMSQKEKKHFDKYFISHEYYLQYTVFADT